MAKIASLVVSLSANSAKLDKDLKQARAKTQKFSRDSILDFKRVASALAAIGTGAGLKGVVEITSRYEDLRTTLGSVFGSTKAGERAFKRIQAISTKTQFGVEELSETFIKLRSAGIEPTDDLIKTFTDTAAVTTDQIGSLQAITDLFSRTTAGGLGLEDLNRLADRGVPVFDILQRKLNLARLEVADFGKTTEGAREILNALSAGIREQFGGATENRLNNLSTLMSNFRIQVANSAEEIGRQLTPALKEAVSELTNFLQANNDIAVALGVGLGEAIRTTAAGLKLLKENMDLVAGAAATIIYIQALRQINFIISDIRRGSSGLTKSLSGLYRLIARHPFIVVGGAIAGLLTYFNSFGRTLAQVSAAVQYISQQMLDFGAYILDLVATPFKWLGDGLEWIANKLGITSDGVDSFVDRLKGIADATTEWATKTIEASSLVEVIRKAGEEYDKTAQAAERLAEAQRIASQRGYGVAKEDWMKTGAGSQGGSGSDSSMGGLITVKERKAISENLSAAIIAGIRDKSGFKGMKEAFAESMQNYFFNEMQTSLESMIGDFMSGLSKSLSKSSTSGGAGGGGWVSDLLDWGASFFSKGGMVPQYLAGGGFAARGTDTVPAMLTPGEVVLNAAQQRNVAGQLGGQNVTINISGNVDQRAIEQIKRVVASDPVMIHQLSRNGQNATTGLRRQQ